MTVETGALVVVTPEADPSAPGGIDRATHQSMKGHEPEVSFMRGMLGHARLGRLVRTNSKMAGVLGSLLEWSTRVPLA